MATAPSSQGAADALRSVLQDPGRTAIDAMTSLLRSFASLGRSCAWFGKPLRRIRTNRHIYRAIDQRRVARWPIIAQELAAAKPGHIFIAGDSHAELLGAPNLGLPVINGGVGAIDTGTYARDLGCLARRPRAAITVLLIGSNDTYHILRPASARRRRAFTAEISGLIEDLRETSDIVLVAAIPPVAAPMAVHRHLPAMAAYSTILANVSAEHGCTFFDPFEDLRGPNPSVAAPGASMDECGAHLKSYDAVAETIRSVIEHRPHADVL